MSEHTFKLVSKFVPTGDQPQAIASILKGIEEGKRYSLERCLTIHLALTLILVILAIHQQYLLLVKRYDAVNIVRTVGIGEIDAIKAYVAKADAIVRHILHEHLGRDSRCAV